MSDARSAIRTRGPLPDSRARVRRIPGTPPLAVSRRSGLGDGGDSGAAYLHGGA